MYFSAEFFYDTSFGATIKEADAVLFGAMGDADSPIFLTTRQFAQTKFYCTNKSKTPFHNPEECEEGAIHALVLEK